METSDRISSGGVIGAEASRPLESPSNQFMPSSGKKRRGRPRKYDEANGTPLPSSSTPLLKKRAKGKLNGFAIKMHKTINSSAKLSIPFISLIINITSSFPSSYEILLTCQKLSCSLNFEHI